MTATAQQLGPDLRARLAAVQGVVFDVDGCLILAGSPAGQDGAALPGAVDAVRAIRATGHRPRSPSRCAAWVSTSPPTRC